MASAAAVPSPSSSSSSASSSASSSSSSSSSAPPGTKTVLAPAVPSPLAAQPQPRPTVLTFALKHRPRATRASVPKVRTGCQTCKKRHVKCDEAKPSCSRCLKWQGFCEGYGEAEAAAAPKPARRAARTRRRDASPPPAAVKQEAAKPPIKREDDDEDEGEGEGGGDDEGPPASPSSAVVRHSASSSSSSFATTTTTTSSSSSSSSPASPALPAILLEPNFNSAVFASQRERAYFDRWLALAPNLGGGWFPSRLWTSTIPQLCRDEPAVRFAALAIGAMAQARAQAPAPPAPRLGRAFAFRHSPHYRLALTYYGRALRLLRLQAVPGGAAAAAAPRTTEAERAAVLSCLLFVCFEALQGNREGALRHITHGLQIVDQFVARNWRPGAAAEPPDPPGSTGPSDPDTGDMGRRRCTTPDAPPPRPLTQSPAPYVLEDEVMQMFRRLDFQAWSLGVFRVHRTLPADVTFRALDALDPASIPARFDSLCDARCWWDLVQHWVLQFPRSMAAALHQTRAANPDAVARAAAAGRLLDICDVPGVRAVQRDYLHCLERWRAAFGPLYDAALRGRCSPAGGMEDKEASTARVDGTADLSGASGEATYLRAVSLRLQFLLAWLGVASLVYSDYETMYQLTPQFRELTRLAALLLPKQPRYAWSPFAGPRVGSLGGGGPGDIFFTMDNGPTMALFVVSCKCRIEAVRQDAVRLLRAYPRRDGFWDSRILHAIGAWNLDIETDNETEGSLDQQWQRLRQREAEFDELQPRIRMTAFVKDPATGVFQKEVQVLRWD